MIANAHAPHITPLPAGPAAQSAYPTYVGGKGSIGVYTKKLGKGKQPDDHLVSRGSQL